MNMNFRCYIKAENIIKNMAGAYSKCGKLASDTVITDDSIEYSINDVKILCETSRPGIWHGDYVRTNLYGKTFYGEITGDTYDFTKSYISWFGHGLYLRNDLLDCENVQLEVVGNITDDIEKIINVV